MHQLAIALLRQGHQITGSDDHITDPAYTQLQLAGILPEAEGWFPERITEKTDAVVLGMHAREDNPELVRAQALHIPIYSFPEYIYEVSKNKKRVVVAGSHGKTTITSMIMHMLRVREFQFDYLVGARVAGFPQSVQITEAPLIVLEGDEYPASVIEKKPKIFFYHPQISVLSGIAWDHINVYPSYDIYFNQFVTWLQMLEPGSILIYNTRDPEVVRLVTQYGSHVQCIPYGMPEYEYRDGKAVILTSTGKFTTSVLGKHNLLNMQAAIAVGQQLGIHADEAYASLTDFTGAARRLEKIHETPHLVAFRDFAHAPSKLKATIEAVREAYPFHQLIACFELHTYSSLSDIFLKQYHASMDMADNGIVYFSPEALALKKLPALDPEIVKKQFGSDNLEVIHNKEILQTKVYTLLSEREKPVCLLLMSSGTFDGIDWNALCSQNN